MVQGNTALCKVGRMAHPYLPDRTHHHPLRNRYTSLCSGSHVASREAMGKREWIGPPVAALVYPYRDLPCSTCSILDLDLHHLCPVVPPPRSRLVGWNVHSPTTTIRDAASLGTFLSTLRTPRHHHGSDGPTNHLGNEARPHLG